MKIVVVTPTLGTSAWLAETVSSVSRLKCVSRHVLVTPPSAMAQLSAQFPSCGIIPEAPGGRGMYAAINAGLAAEENWEAFTYLNDDDLLLPGFAAAAKVAAANAGGQPVLIYGGVKLIDAAGRRLGAIPISPGSKLNRALYAQRLEPVFQHGTLVTRAACEQLGGFDESFRLCGDSEFLARACVEGMQFLRVRGAPLAAFRLRPGQLTKRRAEMQAERARVDQKLGLLKAQPGMRRARWEFRAANFPVYLERVFRHGFISFDELLERGGN